MSNKIFNLRVILRNFMTDLGSFYLHTRQTDFQQGLELQMVLKINENMVHVSRHMLDEPEYLEEGLKVLGFVHDFMRKRGLVFENFEVFRLMSELLCDADPTGQLYLKVFHYLAFLPGYTMTKEEVGKTILKFAFSTTSSRHFLPFFCPAFLTLDSTLIRHLDRHILQTLVNRCVNMDGLLPDEVRQVVVRITELGVDQVIKAWVRHF